MIMHARRESEVVLYQNILNTSIDELEETMEFLESEYKLESISYPYSAPLFDKNAASWAAQLFYISSQLLLYREHKSEELNTLIPSYKGNITPSAILSADLTLRFVPNILKELTLIDNSDILIDILEKQLFTWHYSAIGYPLKNMDNVDMSIIESHDCLKQLYIDRVIDKEAKQLAKNPIIASLLESACGIYKKELCPKFE